MTVNDGLHAPRELISVAEVRRHLGSRVDVGVGIEATGLALSDVAVPDGSLVALTGEVESISEGVVLTGLVAVPWQGSCRRCLEPVEGVFTVEVREVFETHPTDGETWPLTNDQIDVGPLLHDTALLALPLAPICSEGCAGPAPDRYPAGSVADDEHSEEPPRDPRWAALDGLDLDDTSTDSDG